MSAQEELTYKIEMNKIAIEAVSKRIVEYAKKLQEMVNAGNFNVDAGYLWTEGHVSEDVTHVATLIQRSLSMEAALKIVQKYDAKENRCE